MIALELATGRLPFDDAESQIAVLMRQVKQPTPPARKLDPRVDRAVSDWIERLLVKDPRRRTPSAPQAWEELEEVLIARLGARWRRSASLLEPAPAAMRRTGRTPATAPLGVAGLAPTVLPSRARPPCGRTARRAAPASAARRSRLAGLARLARRARARPPGSLFAALRAVVPAPVAARRRSAPASADRARLVHTAAPASGTAPRAASATRGPTTRATTSPTTPTRTRPPDPARGRAALRRDDRQDAGARVPRRARTASSKRRAPANSWA